MYFVKRTLPLSILVAGINNVSKRTGLGGPYSKSGFANCILYQVSGNASIMIASTLEC